MAVSTGQATTAAWTTATALNALHLIGVEIDGPELGVVDTSYLAQSGAAHTYIAKALREDGTISLTYHFDPSVVIPVNGVVDTLLIAWGGAGSTNESTGTVIITGWKPGTVTVDNAELMTVVITAKAAAAWTHNQN